LFSTDPLTPLVGASAGVSGIVIFYGLRFPKAKLRYFRLFKWFSMPAATGVLFWAISQVIGSRAGLLPSPAVSVFAHLGGAAVGLWFWFMWRDD
jgi:membrane associated rhomboid family serine protease